MIERKKSDTSEVVVAVARTGIRSLWFAVIPALLSGLTLRYLVPNPGETDGHGLPFGLATAGNEYPVPLLVGLFVLFTVLARYWRFYLPAGRYLSSLPLPLALRLSRDRLYQYEHPAEVIRSIEGLPPAALPGLPAAASAVDELRTALRVDDPARVLTAERAVVTAAEPLLRRSSRERTITTFVWVAAAAVAALFTRHSVFESYRVLGSSMLPTLKAGDRIGASKASYSLRVPGLAARGDGLPHRGDVIVFQRHPEVGGGESGHLVKRVVGLPGDRVGMQGGIPVINGQLVPNCDAGSYLFVERDYAAYARLLVEFLDGRPHLAVQTPLRQPFDETYVVKPGEVFVLGDNRSNSSDSRAWNGGHGGGVPLASIQGQAEWVLIRNGRNGEVDVKELLRPLGLEVHLDGIETKDLEEGIKRCLNGQSQTKSAER